MRKVAAIAFLAAVMILGLLAAPASELHATVGVSIGINLPGPPPLVPIPGTVIMYAPATPANYFYFVDQYWVFTHGRWHTSSGFNGPWVIVAPAYVPRPLLRVPVRYFRLPPREWRRWRPEAPPHWQPTWGRRWAEHRDPPRQEHRERLRARHGERRRAERR